MQNSFEDFFVKNGYFTVHTNNIGNHMKSISTRLDQCRATYDNIILIEEFNVERDEDNMLHNMFDIK